jgi:hypothetical protein
VFPGATGTDIPTWRGPRWVNPVLARRDRKATPRRSGCCYCHRRRVGALGRAISDVDVVVGTVSVPVRLGSRWRRSRARNSLQRQVDELAGRASEPERVVWKIQPIVEVCGAIDYPVWREARERAWKRDGNRYSTQTWPATIAEGELAAVLLMQSHGGHWRGQPAEIAVPSFARGVPARGHDIEYPYDQLALALIMRWMNLAVADERHTALLAPPLIDLIGRVPKPRTPRDLGIHWPLEPSEPHLRPRRR